MPAHVITARTAPPAITPVPSGAGFSSTMPEPKRPSTVCGTVVCVRLIRIRFFFAASIPLRIACGTSFALPDPKPTTTSVIILRKGCVVANDSVAHLRDLLALPSLEDVFSQLVQQEDTEKIAEDIMDVMQA